MDASIQSTDTTTDSIARTGTTRPKPARKPRTRKPSAKVAQVDAAPAGAQAPQPPQPPEESTVLPEAAGEAKANQEEGDQGRNDRERITQDNAEPDPSNEQTPSEVEKSAAEKERADKKIVDSERADPAIGDAAIGDAAIGDTATAKNAPKPDEPSDVAHGKAHEHATESVRARETPIFAAMFADWDGPAVGLIGRNLHRADAETMVFDAVMWRPGPDRKAPALRFQVSGARHAPLIIAAGELKAGSVALLTTPLQHILRRRPRQVVVDLAGITAVTPAALRALLDVRKTARAAHIDFWLRSPSEPVRELLRTAGASIAVRAKAPAARRPAVPVRKTDSAARAAAPATDEDTEPAAEAQETGARSKAQLITGKLSGGRRRAAAQTRRVLEGVVVEGTAARARQWWPSHALRESLRRVGSHHHPHGQSSPT